ncbi:MAG: DUF4190 domain-containing protein, partial [Deltaproteobacteria bacterium]|nr:DUF4190 domain-containing protein [Deltaproteobacteria bacterium]
MAALLLSLVPICVNVAGVVVGILALREIDRRPNALRGRGLAIAAMVIGSLWVVLEASAILGAPALSRHLARTRQAEARESLSLILAAWQAERGEPSTPPVSTFAELKATLGPDRRYSYFIGDDVLSPSDRPGRELPEDLPADEALIAAAVGDVDFDATLDVWVVTEA